MISYHLIATFHAVAKTLLKQFASSNKDSKTPLVPLLEQFVKKLEPQNDAARERTKAADGPTSLDLASAGVEVDVQKLAVEALRKGNTGELVGSMSSLLLKEREKEGGEMGK